MGEGRKEGGREGGREGGWGLPGKPGSEGTRLSGSKCRRCPMTERGREGGRGGWGLSEREGDQLS